MILNYSLVLLLAATTSWIVFVITKEKKIAVLHLFLLTISPWILTVLLGKPDFRSLVSVGAAASSILDSISILSSFELLFFKGYLKLFYLVGEHGYFLPSFIVPVAVGLWTCLQKDSRQRAILILLLIGFLTGVVLFKILGLVTFLFFIPLLSVIATLGIRELLMIVFRIKDRRILGSLCLINLVWIIYEGMRLWRVIAVWHKLGS